MINNEIVALLKMAVAEETCGTHQQATGGEVITTGVITAPAPKDFVDKSIANNNTPNWWMWIAIAATIYAISKK